jgi:hypothetical protein
MNQIACAVYWTVFFPLFFAASSLVGFPGGNSFVIIVAAKEPGMVVVNMGIKSVTDKAKNPNTSPATVNFLYADAGPSGDRTSVMAFVNARSSVRKSTVFDEAIALGGTTKHN